MGVFWQTEVADCDILHSMQACHWDRVVVLQIVVADRKYPHIGSDTNVASSFPVHLVSLVQHLQRDLSYSHIMCYHLHYKYLNHVRIVIGKQLEIDDIEGGVEIKRGFVTRLHVQSGHVKMAHCMPA